MTANDLRDSVRWPSSVKLLFFTAETRKKKTFLFIIMTVSNIFVTDARVVPRWHGSFLCARKSSCYWKRVHRFFGEFIKTCYSERYLRRYLRNSWRPFLYQGPHMKALIYGIRPLNLQILYIKTFYTYARVIKFLTQKYLCKVRCIT